MRIPILLAVLGATLIACASDKTTSMALLPQKTLISSPTTSTAATIHLGAAIATPIVPTIEKLCPTTREVPLSELHLNEMTNLLLRLNDRWDDGLWTMSVVEQQPRIISHTDETYFNFARISPDGKWLLFIKKGSGEMTKEDRGSLWLVSVNGEQLRAIASLRYEEGILYIKPENISTEWSIPNTSGRIDFSWSDTDEITLMSQIWNAASLDPLFPIFVINSAILQGRYFLKSGESAGWNLGLQLGENYIWDGKGYEVYKRWNSPEFFLYDRVDDTSLDIFKWLENEDWIIWDAATLLGFGYWQDELGLETIVIIRPHGFDIAYGLDFVTITEAIEYNEVMKKVIIPPGEGHLGENRYPTNLRLNWVSNDGSNFGLLVDSPDEGKQYYIFEPQNMTLKDFCRLPIGNIFAKASPDGKYLAWGGEDSVVLELATGKFAHLSDMVFLDWIAIEQ